MEWHRPMQARVKTTIIEINRIMQGYEHRFVEPVHRSLIDDGVNILEGIVVDRVENGRSTIKLHLSSGSALVVSDLLIAVGRVPNIEKLALAEAGIKYNELGVVVDRNLQTTNRSVYAFGDLVDGPSFTHTASYHAGIVLKKILFGLSSTMQTIHIPQVTYTTRKLHRSD